MHLTIRVAWHDNRWDGTICRAPSDNSFCIALDRIRESPRDDVAEDRLAGRHWADLQTDALPPCQAEAGAFMSAREWRRVVKHPYQLLPKTRETHGHLKPTVRNVPPYATYAVPFWWMLRENQEALESALPDPLPPDQDSPFRSPWVFSAARQEAISRLFFGRLDPASSLVLFYTKEGHPFGDDLIRLLVGVGSITSIARIDYYDSAVPDRPTHPIWDRLICHSIRPNGAEGFLLPYHDYLASTGDPDEDMRRQILAKEMAVAPQPDHLRGFSYMSELVSADVALSTLVQCLEAVRRVKAHGLARGPWDAREEWLNAQMAAVWQERGAFPGLGSLLEAMGLRMGTALALDLLEVGVVQPSEDPWPVVDAILRGREAPPKPPYQGDVEALASTWCGLSEQRRSLLQLLSRFDLTPGQAKRWFNPEKRPVSLTDEEIIANPYRIAEVDLGDPMDGPVSVGVIDRGVLPDATVAARHPVPEPSAVDSQLDVRRVRAAIVGVLRAAAEEGDSLLAEPEVIDRLVRLSLAHPCSVTSDWVQANLEGLAGVVEQLNLRIPEPRAEEPDHTVDLRALQLSALAQREDRLRKILTARAAKPLPSTGVDWAAPIIEAIKDRGHSYDPENRRHSAALEEQALALEKVTTRKTSVLVGRAGTGKTSALGAILRCQPVAKDGILLLAPTGKARVLLGRAAGSEAMTVAQFLYSLGRYDGPRQRPLFSGKKQHHQERTVIIDECSMLTMDDLFAVVQALDIVHVQRIILVGDPNQLPPIGVGRPFADFVGSLELASTSLDSARRNLAGALGKLTVEVRSAAEGASDTLRLASWFTRDQQPADADKVFSDLEQASAFNDLEIRFWKKPEELRDHLFQAFCNHLGLEAPDDTGGFDRALGLTEKRWVDFANPDGAENFQILSPVRMHPHGIYAINRLIQQQYRSAEVSRARQEPWRVSLGNEEIVIRDKVIQVQNQRRRGYSRETKKQDYLYLANGEVGICAIDQHGFLNVAFAGRPWWTVGYRNSDFPGGSGPLELAYALTVHKAQGSEFGKVFVVVPRNCRLLSRELLYTALTRSRQQLVLLIEGDDASVLYTYTRPESSETVRRNTNLFQAAVRAQRDEVPYAEHLIHRTLKGHMVRSKSELVIANMLYQMDLDYQYEPRYEGISVSGVVRPDFMFADPAGDPIIWEHLGMLTRDDYRQSWQRKRHWYLQDGFVEGASLFTTQDDEKGGLDSEEVRTIAQQIKQLI